MGDDVGVPARPWVELTQAERLAWAAGIAPLVEVDREARTIVAAGTCPVCEHGFSAMLTDADLLVESGDIAIDRSPRAPAWEGVIKFTIACYCAGEHPGRPTSVTHGCGASGPLKDTP